MALPIDAVRARLERSERARLERARARADRPLALLPAARELLATRYDVREGAVFGSLAHGRPAGNCDVDLAVRGLDPARYFDALAQLMELFGCGVDLVRVEDAPEVLRQRIDEEGKPL